MKTVRELATVYVLYGTLAEIFGREYGFNKGMGGSMHAFFPPFGVMPNNAIVGGSADIAVGSALYKRINRKPGIVIANIGDASMGCGPVWEAITLSAMDQYRSLWPEEIGGAPPMMFNFMNNFYGMGGQPMGETMGFDMLARVGLGVNRRGDAFGTRGRLQSAGRGGCGRAQAKLLLAGQGPVLLDTITYRFSGHSPSDAMAYRTKEELDLWQEQDAIVGFGQYLLDNGHADEGELSAFHEESVEWLVKVLEAAVSLEVSPRVDVYTDAIGDMMFSDQAAGQLRRRLSRRCCCPWKRRD